MLIQDLGTLDYRAAWALQERAHEEVLAGGEERIFLVEHPPVITYGRRPGVDQNVIASADQLARMGVDVVPSDRGGDVTFHGPGQLVIYPIIRLADHGLSVGCYVHSLEAAVIDYLRTLNIEAHSEPKAVGVWVGDAKVCAIGVRIRRGVSMHGLAINVTTNLDYFQLIVPCGLVGRPVTSLEKLIGQGSPSLEHVKSELSQALVNRIANATSLQCG